eukprot:TRINITY_DN3836_c0_g1_i1.p1 TRINITY_DN3836_c0_g1~~TRINITY_DN3836_c0_g1_i1.p1  ORF type:complete len:274 (+),score=34.60 TRINITY_DN3836_c0_g1_i1:62-883(+)
MVDACEDVFLLICGWLPVPSLALCAPVCRKWSALISADELWGELLRRDSMVQHCQTEAPVSPVRARYRRAIERLVDKMLKVEAFLRYAPHRWQKPTVVMFCVRGHVASLEQLLQEQEDTSWLNAPCHYEGLKRNMFIGRATRLAALTWQLNKCTMKKEFGQPQVLGEWEAVFFPEPVSPTGCQIGQALFGPVSLDKEMFTPLDAGDPGTPLHWACVAGQVDVVRWLLQQPQVDVDIPFAGKYTAWDIAHTNLHYEIAQLLVQHRRGSTKPETN